MSHGLRMVLAILLVMPVTLGGCGGGAMPPADNTNDNDNGDMPLICEMLPSAISTDTTLDGECYEVSGTTRVSGSATLTIEPGVTLVFQQNAGLTISADGRMSAVGTAAEPIMFTADERVRGFWDGVRMDRSNSLNNRLEYVTIEYGGGAWNGNLFLDGTSAAPSRAAMNNCTFRESATFGFYFDTDAIVDEFRGNTVTSNAMGAGSVVAGGAGFLDGSGTYADNDVDIVEVRGGSVETDQAWPALDVPYLLTANTRVDAVLTIEPGVHVRVGQGREVTIAENGRLVASGTASDGIVFTGDEPLRGFWGGLRFDRSNSTANALEHVTIEHGGGTWNGNLFLDGTSATPSRVAIRNCTFGESESFGLYYDTDAILEAFENNACTSNTLGAASMTAPQLGSLDAASSYTGNDLDIVEVRGGTVAATQSWSALDAPYLFSANLRVEAGVTIQPGAELVFAAGRDLTIAVDGSLAAVGTAAEPILFRGEQSTAGYWGGVRFDRSASPLNRIEYVTMRDGGGSWNGNLFVDGISALSSTVEVTNSTFSNSATWGIYLDTDAQVNDDIETANTFSGNTAGTVRFP